MGKKKPKHRRPRVKEPIVPAQQQASLAPTRQSSWTRLRIFLTTPSWQGFGTWLGVVLAVVLFIVSYIITEKKEKEATEQSLSRISYAWFIKPAPVPGEQFETTARWEVSVMVANGGPATAETVVLHLTTPPPSGFLHSAPTLMSSAAAARVDILERTPEGIYQIVYNNLTPGDGATVHLFYLVPDEKKQMFMRAWHDGGMFKKEFAKNFINQFFFTGAHLRISNFGAMDYEPSFKNTE